MSNFAKLAAALEKAGMVSDEHSAVTCWLDTGFAPLNHAISGRYDGGFPAGRIVEIFGPESSGKTWLATQAMISAQKAGGFACFHDHERSFDLNLARKLGLDASAGRFIFRTPRTFEESVTAFIKTSTAIRESKELDPKAPMVWVFDSLPSMVPQQMLAKDATDLNMNDTTALARLTSKVLPAVAQIAERDNVLVILLNQIRLKPGVVYGDPTTTPGGNAPKYYASVRIQLGATRLTREENGEKVMVGQEVSARCIKNKVARPFALARYRFVFGEDGAGRFDVAGSLVDFAVAKKLLNQAGSRIEWTDGKTYHRSQLVTKLENEGRVGELQALIAGSGVKTDEQPPAEDDLVA
jgi:recombination protein RecA